MRKTLIAIIVVLIVAVVGAIFYVFSNLDAIVEAAIEQYGTEAVKTSVQVDGVAIQLTEGAATIQGLTVANPDGFSLPHAFSLGEIGVDINLEKTDKELIAIDAIRIAAPQVFYEINAEGQASLNILADNLGSDSGASSPTSAPDEPSTAGQTPPLQLDIARFELQDASLRARLVPLDNKTYDLTLPALVLTNLQGTPEQISTQVLDRLIDHAREEVKKQGLDKELDELKGEVQQRIDEQLEEQKQEVEDNLRNLLNR